jgi:hypothetical protein
MKKCTRQANRKAAIFSATLLGTALILAVSFTSDPVQPVEAQQLSMSAQVFAMRDDAALHDAALYEEGDEIADMFPDAPVDERAQALHVD